jgi:hypothetical protein
MLDPIQIEQTYKQFMDNLSNWAHDGIVHIDLHALHELGILASMQSDISDPDDLTQYFHVIESVEKVTLFNDQFIVWIIPRMDEEIPMTYVLIALNYPEEAHLEIVFTTAGVYNTPRYVLRVLQHYLLDMLETEATLTSIQKDQ